MNTDGFLALLEASAPSSWEVLMAEYEGPLPAACDERYHNVCQAYRQLSPPERCEAEERMSTGQRDWLRAAPDRMAMLSVRLQAPAYLEDALIGAFMNFPVAVTDPLEFQGYRGILAICRRCAQLLGLGPEAFEGQMIYICRDDARRDVREFMMGAASDQQPARWGFREETGDHGIIFRSGFFSSRLRRNVGFLSGAAARVITRLRNRGYMHVTCHIRPLCTIGTDY